MNTERILRLIEHCIMASALASVMALGLTAAANSADGGDTGACKAPLIPISVVTDDGTLARQCISPGAGA